jgi:hypothetical protein
MLIRIIDTVPIMNKGMVLIQLPVIGIFVVQISGVKSQIGIMCPEKRTDR